jgi:hypothetical protein
MNLADGLPRAANFSCFSRFPLVEQSASVGRTCCENPADQADRADGAEFCSSEKSAGDIIRTQLKRVSCGQTHIQPTETKTQTPAAGSSCVGKYRKERNSAGSPARRRFARPPALTYRKPYPLQAGKSIITVGGVRRGEFMSCGLQSTRINQDYSMWRGD